MIWEGEILRIPSNLSEEIIRNPTISNSGSVFRTHNPVVFPFVLEDFSRKNSWVLICYIFKIFIAHLKLCKEGKGSASATLTRLFLTRRSLNPRVHYSLSPSWILSIFYSGFHYSTLSHPSIDLVSLKSLVSIQGLLLVLWKVPELPKYVAESTHEG